MPETILVSACLLGFRCRYDGTAKINLQALAFLRDHGFTPVPVCPEQLGGLSTPRSPCRFDCGDGTGVLNGNGRLFDDQGQDRTGAFLRGAHAALAITRDHGCRLALMKERSPSCGPHWVHDRQGIQTGSGVAATLLKREGIPVFSEEELAALEEFLNNAALKEKILVKSKQE
ncbi:MAG: DUF523 domain-containing protein [Deltaproteobacteria bacterium]|nr:DUF523 domain-containing protein [Deltaproteobacteria bacterium]